ncbi:MAG: LCP family protein [candidate division WOR-3 bacterium]
MARKKLGGLILLLTGILMLIIVSVIIFILSPRSASKPVSLLNETGNSFNILLIGRDARALNPAQDRGGITRIPREKTAHSDIVIIAHINLELNRVSLVAIPRDLLVEVPGITAAGDRTDFNRMEKLTHTLAIGGVPLLRQTLEQLLGIKIHRYVALDFDTFRMLFRLLTRFLGPLRVGNLLLTDPEQALKFVRQRNYLKYDDLDRCRNALNFIRSAAGRLWFVSGTRAGELLIDQFFRTVGTDTDLTPAEARYLFGMLRKNRFTPGKLRLAVLVSEGRPVTLDRYMITLSCYLPIYPEMERQIRHFLRDEDTVPALDFMTQQHYSWPWYMTRNYDLLPEYQEDTLERLDLVRRILEKAVLPPESGI